MLTLQFNPNRRVWTVGGQNPNRTQTEQLGSKPTTFTLDTGATSMFRSKQEEELLQNRLNIEVHVN